MSEQRPVPQQFPSRRQRRAQQESPVAPRSTPAASRQSRGTQPKPPQGPVASTPVPGPWAAQPPVASPSVVPPQVVSQVPTSGVSPVGSQSHAETSGTARPASSHPTRPVPPGAAGHTAMNPPVPGMAKPAVPGAVNLPVSGATTPAVAGGATPRLLLQPLPDLLLVRHDRRRPHSPLVSPRHSP